MIKLLVAAALACSLATTPAFAAGKGKPAAAARKKKGATPTQLGSPSPAWDVLKSYVPAGDGLALRADTGLLLGSLPAEAREGLLALAAASDADCIEWFFTGAMRDVVVVGSMGSGQKIIGGFGFAPGSDHARAASCVTARWKNAHREGEDMVGEDSMGRTQHLRWLPGSDVLVWSELGESELTALLASPTATPSPEITSLIDAAPQSAPLVFAGAGGGMSGSLVIDLGKDGFDVSVGLTLDREDTARMVEQYWGQMVGQAKSALPPEIVGFIERAVLSRVGNTIKLVTTISHLELVALAGWAQKELADMGLAPRPAPVVKTPPRKKKIR